MRILLADDHALLRDILTLLFQNEGDISVVNVSDLDAALRAIETEGPFDLVLLDYSMPGMNGLEGLERALHLSGGGNVALISGVASREVAERAMDLGARGFLTKSVTGKSLVNAIRFMVAGERFAPLGFMLHSDEDDAVAQATRDLLPREIEVLRGLSKGKTNKELCRDMNVQEPTVKRYVRTLFRKIGAKNRTQAALYGRSLGLL